MKISLAVLGLLVSFAMAACHRSQDPSLLKENAIPNDPNARILRIVDGFESYPVLVTENKGYRIRCENIAQLGPFIEGLGLDSGLIGFIPTLSVDSDEVLALAIANQPELSCDGGDARLYVIEYGQTLKYFISFPQSSTTLYMLGCQGLVDVLGLNKAEAEPIPSHLAHFFDTSDEHDINCLAGDPVYVPLELNPRIVWEMDDDELSFNGLVGGEDINLELHASLMDADGDLSFQLGATDCSIGGDWFQIVGRNVLLANIPSSFAGELCSVSVSAYSAENELSSEPLIITFKGQPVISWQMQSSLPSFVDLVGDEILHLNLNAVSSEPGRSISYRIEQINCTIDVNSFAIISDDVLFVRLPYNFKGQRCDVSMIAEDTEIGLQSQPLTVSYIGRSMIVWNHETTTYKDLYPGNKIAFELQAEVKNSDEAIVYSSSRTSACNWLVQNKSLVSGKVPDNFYNKTCSITVKATAGDLESSRSFYFIGMKDKTFSHPTVRVQGASGNRSIWKASLNGVSQYTHNGNRFCQEQGYNIMHASTEKCGQDEASYAYYNNSLKKWTLKSSGSANDRNPNHCLYPLYKTITCRKLKFPIFLPPVITLPIEGLLIQ